RRRDAGICEKNQVRVRMKTQCLPVRMSSYSTIKLIMMDTCSFGTPSASTQTQASGKRWRGRSAARGWCLNDALAARRAAREAGLPSISDAAMSARLTEAKGTPERAWLAEVSSVVLQQALADLNAAYRNFFASATGKRTGPKVALPRFRSRKDSRQ